MISIPRPDESSDPTVDDFDGSSNLLKASVDSYVYAIGLRNGLVFVCESVELSGQFVSLNRARPVIDPAGQHNFTWGRPLDVRLSEIAWVGDCES